MAWRKRVRKRTLEAQNGICPYCDSLISQPTNHHRNYHVQDGLDVVVCCQKCHDKINTVEKIFQRANDRLRQEIVYSILIVAPPHLAKELSEVNPNGAIARFEGATLFSVETIFKPKGDLR